MPFSTIDQYVLDCSGVAQEYLFVEIGSIIPAAQKSHQLHAPWIRQEIDRNLPDYIRCKNGGNTGLQK